MYLKLVNLLYVTIVNSTKIGINSKKTTFIKHFLKYTGADIGFHSGDAKF